MYLFEDIEEVKKYIGGGANVSIELDSIEPTMIMAVEKHLKECIGANLFKALVEPADPLTPEQELLLTYLKRPAAFLTMYEYASIGGIQFTEAGIHRAENQNMKSAYKYQENEYKAKMLEFGYDAKEHLLIYLDANRETFADWAASAAGQNNRKYFINYAMQFRGVYSKSISRYTFEILTSLMEDVEEFAIRSTIGDLLFDHLKAKILAGDPSGKEKMLIQKIQRAVANFTIEEGMKRQWVRIEGRNVIQSEESDNQSYEKKQSASAAGMNVALRHANEFGNRHISAITKYLKDNSEEFPLYQVPLDNTEESQETIDFERSRCQRCDGQCKCQKKNKSITRL